MTTEEEIDLVDSRIRDAEDSKQQLAKILAGGFKANRRDLVTKLKDEKETKIQEDKPKGLSIRAYKELPHFFKFPLIKNKPKRLEKVEFKGEERELLPRPITIEFQRIKAEITYYAGELGDQDRLVWLAVINQAIRYKEFVKEFGWIPFSIEDITKEINITARSVIKESLERLSLTRIKFLTPFGSFAFRGAFHLITEVVSIEAKKVKDDINDKLENIALPLPNLIISDNFANQAKMMLQKIKPRTSKLTIIKFHHFLMDALISNQITTIDMEALKTLKHSGERTLFLYFYDISQWREAEEPLDVPISEMMQLLDLKSHKLIVNNIEYIDWTRVIEQITKKMNNVKKYAKFILNFSWKGEKAKSYLAVKLLPKTIQIPY